MVPIVMQQPYKRLSRVVPIFFLQQIKHQREHIGRLRVCARQAVRRNEVFSEFTSDRLIKPLIFLCFLSIFQPFGRFRQQLYRVCIKRRGNIVGRCSADPSALPIIESQPIAKLFTGIPEEWIFPLPLYILHPSLHAVVLFFQHPLISIAQEKRPRADHSGISPRRRASIGHLPYIRDNICYTILIRLIGSQIPQPFAEKQHRVHIEARCADKHLRIARPSVAFVALRAVRRNIHKIALLSPQYIVLKLVYQLIGASKAPALLHL